MNLGPQQLRILAHLCDTASPRSPTAIGMAMGCLYSEASSWACPKLKGLVKQGLVERSDRAKYCATPEGARLVRELQPEML
jgi:predicted transcriptional regulator